MTVLSAQSIRLMAKPVEGGPALLSPFFERTLHAGTGMTYGLSPCGYDIRVREELVIDAGRMKLGSSIEHFHLPDDLCAAVYTKSTWARRGVFMPPTTLEPGWKGYLTLEIHYGGGYSAIGIEAGAPIAEIRFELLDRPTEHPYRGKYQDQPPFPVIAIHEKEPAE